MRFIRWLDKITNDWEHYLERRTWRDISEDLYAWIGIKLFYRHAPRFRKVHLVKFNDGAYGVRRKSGDGWAYWDLRNGDSGWWHAAEYVSAYCHGSYGEAMKALLTHEDIGNPMIMHKI